MSVLQVEFVAAETAALVPADIPQAENLAPRGMIPIFLQPPSEARRTLAMRSLIWSREPRPPYLSIERDISGEQPTKQQLFVRGDWREERACSSGTDALLFMVPDDGETAKDRSRRERRAKEFCAGCAVVWACATSAIINEESGATWGGLNDRQRKQLKKALGDAGLTVYQKPKSAKSATSGSSNTDKAD